MTIDLEITDEEVEILGRGGLLMMLIEGYKIVVSLDDLTESEDKE